MVAKSSSQPRPGKSQKSPKKKAFSRPGRVKLSPRQRLARLRRNERGALRDFVARLREKFGDRIQHVILYGSRARGEGDGESDLDVLVVVDEVDNLAKDIIDRAAFEIIMQYDNALLSPRIWSLERLNTYRRDQLLFYRNIKRDGIELWTPVEKLS